MRIYGIIYGDKTTDFISYRNEPREKAWRFEYNAMIDICDGINEFHDKSDYLGILSWKFTKKTSLTKHSLIDLAMLKVINDPNKKGIGIINLSPKFSYPIGGMYKTFMDWSEAGHIGITDLIRACCAHIGFQYFPEPAHVVYANQFLATKAVYTDYMNTVIKPCLALLEGPLWDRVNVPAGYTAGLEAAELKRCTGLEFYNFVPFVLERMMMQYIENKNIKTHDLI